LAIAGTDDWSRKREKEKEKKRKKVKRNKMFEYFGNFPCENHIRFSIQTMESIFRFMFRV